MKRAVILFAGILVFAVSGPSALQTASKSSPAHQKSAQKTESRQSPVVRHVIVISVDGLMPESYTAPDSHGLKVPTLRALAEHGAASAGVRGVMPSVTYASHSTIVTGVNPLTHGIIANTVFDPEGKRDGEWFWYAEELRVPTLWDAARQKGLRTALINWPVTMGAQANFLVPEFWRGFGADGANLLRAISTPGLLAAVEKHFPGNAAGLTPPSARDESLSDIAVHVIETGRVNLLLLHIAEVDHWQHETGPWSQRAVAAIENADLQIGRVIEAAKTAGTWDQTVMVVVSDHGFARHSHVLRPGVLLRQKGLVTMDEKTPTKIIAWKAQALSSGGSAYIYLKDPADVETQRAVRELLLGLAGKAGSGIARVLTAEQVAVMGGDAAAFLAIEAADDFGFAGGVTGELITNAATPGLHGFPPDRKEMDSSLLFFGATISPGKIENARLIDIGPTIARLLGLRLERAEGRALELPGKPSLRPAN